MLQVYIDTERARAYTCIHGPTFIHKRIHILTVYLKTRTHNT